MLGMAGIGWLLGAGLVLWTTRGPGQGVAEWMVWSILLPGAAFVLAALYKAKRGWRLPDMRTGARAEETIGQAIEYALTRDACAVAHHVEEIARVGDIDHLVATPNALWVIETKHTRVPKSEFPETLRRIAANVQGVREWAPGTRVTGCLVFASDQQKSPKPTFKHGEETIKAFANRTALMRELRKEARGSGGSRELATRVWKLGKLETPDQPGPEPAVPPSPHTWGKAAKSERTRRRGGKTAGVKALVNDVLALPDFRDPTDHVIRDVFLAIQRNDGWRQRYDALCKDIGVDLVNQWGGRYVFYHFGKPRKKGRADAGAGELIDSYTILDSQDMRT